MRYEFHSHTFLSDGELHPIEHIRRAHHAGHAAIALTDHVGVHDVEPIVKRLAKECEADLRLLGQDPARHACRTAPYPGDRQGRPQGRGADRRGARGDG